MGYCTCKIDFGILFGDIIINNLYALESSHNSCIYSCELEYGVPQGSVWGPITICTTAEPSDNAFKPVYLQVYDMSVNDSVNYRVAYIFVPYKSLHSKKVRSATSIFCLNIFHLCVNPSSIFLSLLLTKNRCNYS